MLHYIEQDLTEEWIAVGLADLEHYLWKWAKVDALFAQPPPPPRPGEIRKPR